MNGFVLLTLAYVAVAALLLNFGIHSKWRMWVKVSGVLLVTAFYFATYHGLRGLSGLPSGEPVPGQFRLLWVSVDEPDKITGSAGAVYIWARSLDEQSGQPIGEPRAHKLPYSEELAEDAETALAKLEDGKRLNGRRSRQQISQAEEEALQERSQQREITGESGSEASGSNDFTIVFKEVPPPDLPPKPAL